MPTCVMPNAQGFLAVVADMSQTACEGGFVAITSAVLNANNRAIIRGRAYLILTRVLANRTRF